MTPREVISNTLNFSKPDRIGRQTWLLPWAQDHYPRETKHILQHYPDDIVYAPPELKESLKTKGDMYVVGTYIDEWGCEFDNRQKGVIGEVKEPMIQDWDDISKIHIPRERLTVDREKINAFCKASDKYVLPSFFPRPFEQLQFLRGTENVMMDLALGESELLKLLDILHTFYMEEIEIWAKTDVDGLFFMDDWGTQRSLLISPDQWRQFFKPLYQDYIDTAHKHGKKIFMHSDGYILDIFSDLIEIGLDAINSQIFCMGVEKLAPFAGKITFWGEIDRQYLLCDGTEEEIRQAVYSVYETLYKDGGVIGQVDFGVGAKPDKVETAFLTWEEISKQL